MEIVYVISVIVLLVIFMLIKKSDKELNGLGIFGLGLVLILCYNVLECYVLNFFRINLSLLNLSIVNSILDIIGIVYLVKKKEIQKYNVELRDLIYVFLLGMFIIVLGKVHYGYPLMIKYETTDPATHYRAAYDFATSESLINNNPDSLWGFKDWKIASYVNSGLIMKVFSNVMDEFEYYKIFIIFDMFIFFLTGFIMYMAFVKLSKGKMSLVAFVVTLLFVLGYPLNSMLFGFSYMSLGILIVTSLLYAVSYYTNKEIRLKHICGILFLLNFMLFHAYFQFVPYMYAGLFIYICLFNYREEKRIFTKKNILTLIVTLIIPFILGFIYYMAQDLYNLNFNGLIKNSIERQTGLLNGFSTDGYVYNNLYSNIILLLPMVIYVAIKERKNIDFSTVAVVFTIGYIVLLLVRFYQGEASNYYVTKNYFALWVILWYIVFKGLVYLYEKKKMIPYIVLVVYIAILAFAYIKFYNTPIKNTLENYKPVSVAEIYISNKVMIKQTACDYHIYELQLMEYVKNNLDKDKKIEMLGSEQQILWVYPLLDYYYYYPEMENFWFQHKLTYKHGNKEIIENADYIICLYRSNFYNEYDESLLENKEVLYENVFGKVIKNK